MGLLCIRSVCIVAIVIYGVTAFTVMRDDPVKRRKKQRVPGAPRNLRVESINSTSMFVEWDPPEDDNKHGIIIGYVVYYIEIGSNDEPRPHAYQKREQTNSASQTEVVINGLKSDTRYHVSVAAFTRKGDGLRTNPKVLVTKGAAPSGSPLNFTATGISETSVRLTWDLPARNLRNGEVIMYQVTFHPMSDPIAEEDYNCTDTFLDLVGLEMNTDYSFRIKAYTSKGAGPWSNRLHFRTLGRKVTDDCPQGWLKFTDDAQTTCFYFSTGSDISSYDDSTAACQDMDAELAYGIPGSGGMQFVSDQVIDLEGDYWVGIRKDEGYDEQYTCADNTELPEDTLPSTMKDYKPFKEQCAFMSSFVEDLEPDDCEHEYHYVCQKKLECPENRFGHRCARECHCLGDLCDTSQENVTCSQGCQRDWYGPACDKPRRQPEINYFCSKDPRMIQIRLITNGFEHINVQSIHLNGARYSYDRGDYSEQTMHTCSPTSYWRPGDTPGQYSIVIRSDSYRHYGKIPGISPTHVCNSGSVSRWLIEVKENPTINLEHDYKAMVSCNFSSADRQGTEQDVQIQKTRPRVPKIPVLTSDSFTDDISLTIVEYESGENINGTAQLGTPVFLRLKYGLQEGSHIKGVQPCDCSIGPQNSTDNSGLGYRRLSSKFQTFINAYGCPTTNAVISPFVKTNNQTLETKWFPLFEIDGYTTLTAKCSYTICFKEEECAAPTCSGRRYARDVSKHRHQKGHRGQQHEMKSSTAKPSIAKPSSAKSSTEKPIVSQTVKVLPPKDDQLPNNSA